MRRWWLAYGCGVALVCAALLSVSRDVLDLEASEAGARAENLHQERLRLALWRMDSWLAPRLTSEAARPYFEYSAYYPQERPYESLLRQPDDPADLVQSPLLSWQSPDIPLHLQVDADGRYSSPQVPTGALREDAVMVCLSEDDADQSAALLAQVERSLPAPTLVAAVEAATLGQAFEREPPTVRAGAAVSPEGPAQQQWLNSVEFNKRAQNVSDSNRLGNYLPTVTAGGLTVGPFVPVWFGEPSQLVFARRVSLGGRVVHQGFLVEWTRLRDHLLAEVSDLVAAPGLVPLVDCRPSEEEAGLVLASVPALLQAEPLPLPPGSDGEALSPVRRALVLSWGAVLVALVGVGLVLRSAVVLGERRVRFASAVTHELRTPLTTFRLYAEMLADDMVSDPVQRAEYLATLRDESDRLARLVENVLSYARLEQGRAPVQPQDTTLGELLERSLPTLRRRVEDGAMSLQVDDGGQAAEALRTDVSVVGQVLFNLVDNAVKYAAAGEVRLTARVRDGQAELVVEDDGPGVSGAGLRRLFRPFERSAPESTPGVGLGLSLSRGLARELGGDLELVSSPDEGARFRLQLPRRI